MEEAGGWYTCRAGHVETVRAVGLAAGSRPSKAVAEEWPAFGIVEIDQALVEHAAALAIDRELRSLDFLNVAAALLPGGDDLVFATWDLPLHTAAGTEGLPLLLESLD